MRYHYDGIAFFFLVCKKYFKLIFVKIELLKLNLSFAGMFFVCC